MTTGEIMFYGGLLVIAVGIVLFLLLIPLFSHQRKKLEKKIREEYL